MAKPCKTCGGTGHTAFNCPKKPRKPLQTKTRLQARKPMRKIGKVGRKWLDTRDKWLAQHKAPYYFCYICNKMLTRTQLTLDHVESRSRYPELRFALKNLQPCCWDCNTAKGSLSLEEYLETIKKG